VTRPAQARFLAFEDFDADATFALAEAPAAQPIEKPDELSWWDWAVFLLHTVAEIEHALMVQYLYAAYSLADDNFTGTHLPTDPGPGDLTGKWRDTIIGIAKEEMAHLLTEQNLLRFIGGPLNFEREDFPIRTTLYPFPLVLEPLTKTSLAKYISAEMPAHPDVPDIEDIVRRATDATGGMHPNRVGVLFETLEHIFGDETKILEADLRPETASRQAKPRDWHVPPPPPEHMIIRTVASRDDAIQALKRIGDQGEGSGSSSTDPSHFERFLEIYRAFPETETDEPYWVPTRSIPTNPTTVPPPTSGPDPEAARRITHPTTRRWAQLFNVRYRMLLTDIAHALLLGPLDEGGPPTLRAQLRNWAFIEMTVGVKGIAKRLTTEPAKEAPAAEDPAHAGAPFELPYTFAISDDEHDRWRLHLALLDASRDLLETLPHDDSLVVQIGRLDDNARRVVAAQLHPPAPTPPAPT
jgi:hypothetical protein